MFPTHFVWNESNPSFPLLSAHPLLSAVASKRASEPWSKQNIIGEPKEVSLIYLLSMQISLKLCSVFFFFIFFSLAGKGKQTKLQGIRTENEEISIYMPYHTTKGASFKVTNWGWDV